jgi:outer membrane lipoprotein carrier protein
VQWLPRADWPVWEPPPLLGRNTGMTYLLEKTPSSPAQSGSLIALLLAVSLGAVPAAPAQTADAIIERAAATWSNVRTIQGTFEQTVTNSLTDGTASSRGTYAQQRPNHLAIRFSTPASDAVVADGTNLWIYLPSSAPGQVIKRRATERGSAPIDLTGQFLDSPRTRYDASPAGARTIDGHAAHGVTLVPKAGTSSPFTRATVWVDDDDSLIRSFEETETNGITRSVHLTSVKLNAPIDRATFRFAIPKGARVVDQTMG